MEARKLTSRIVSPFGTREESPLRRSRHRMTSGNPTRRRNATFQMLLRESTARKSTPPHEHTRHDHAQGAQRGANGIHGAHQQRRQRKVQEKQHAPGKDGEDVHIQKNFAPGDRALSAEQHTAVAPQQRQLHDDKHAGENDPLLAQNGADNGNDQVPGVGVDDGGLLHRTQAQRPAAQRRQQKQHGRVWPRQSPATAAARETCPGVQSIWKAPTITQGMTRYSTTTERTRLSSGFKRRARTSSQPRKMHKNS